MAKIKGYERLLTRRKRNKLNNLEARIEEEIRQLEDEILSVGITDSNLEPLFSEIVKARQNTDLPEWPEVREFSEELLAYVQRLEADTVAEIEERTHSDWLLPTSTLYLKYFPQALSQKLLDSLETKFLLGV